MIGSATLFKNIRGKKKVVMYELKGYSIIFFPNAASARRSRRKRHVAAFKNMRSGLDLVNTMEEKKRMGTIKRKADFPKLIQK